MKKLLAIILLTTMIFTMTACSSASVVSDMKTDYTEQISFDRYRIDDKYSILVDRETKVCYLEYSMPYRCGITVLFNADGTPKIWED